MNTMTLYNAQNLAHWRCLPGGDKSYPRAYRQYKKFYAAFIARIEAGDRAREALKLVEWVDNGDYFDYCPWCKGFDNQRGHDFDCPRQLALGEKP